MPASAERQPVAAWSAYVRNLSKLTEPNDGLRGFPPNLIKDNLLKMVELAQQNNITVLVSQIQIPPNYGPRYNKMFSDIFVEVTEQTNSTLLPFFIEQVATDPTLMQADGIHPTKAAQPILAKRMKQILDDALAISTPQQAE